MGWKLDRGDSVVAGVLFGIAAFDPIPGQAGVDAMVADRQFACVEWPDAEIRVVRVDDDGVPPLANSPQRGKAQDVRSVEVCQNMLLPWTGRQQTMRATHAGTGFKIIGEFGEEASGQKAT